MKFILFLTALLCSMLSYSQDYVTGKVYDAKTNTPLAGASVSIANKGITATDVEGNFRIECTKGVKISVSYVGYAKRNITLPSMIAASRSALH
jgi:hypothetical protein